MVIFQTSREGSALFSDVVPVPRAVEFKMATGCKFGRGFIGYPKGRNRDIKFVN